MKYVCINDTRTEGSKYFQQWCVIGEIYTLERSTGSLVGKRGLIFKELKNDPVFIPELGGYTTPSFAADRFVELTGELDKIEENEEAEVTQS